VQKPYVLQYAFEIFDVATDADSATYQRLGGSEPSFEHLFKNGGRAGDADDGSALPQGFCNTRRSPDVFETVFVIAVRAADVNAACDGRHGIADATGEAQKCWFQGGT
jgi:hypothetical protein